MIHAIIAVILVPIVLACGVAEGRWRQRTGQDYPWWP